MPRHKLLLFINFQQRIIMQMRPIILGCGNIGSSVARKLAALRKDLQLIVADWNLPAAEALAAEIGGGTIACHVDVNDPESLNKVLSQGNVVLNTVGPFYRTALFVIEAAITAKVHYIDINDDHDVAAQLVLDPSYDRRAKDAGTIILIGCGATPGFTNVLAKHGSERLDKTSSIRLCWVVPFVVQGFSPAIMDHLFHMLSGEVIQFIDGKHQKVPAYSGTRDVDFLPPFRSYPAYFSGHGEPVTLGHFIPGLEEATIRSYFYPKTADDLMRFLVESGFGSRDEVPGLGLSPMEFITGYAASAAGQRALRVEQGDEVFGYASQVEISGERGGDKVRLVFEQHQLLGGNTENQSEGGDPTAVCARLSLESVLDGKVNLRGFLAPEACLETQSFIKAVITETGITIHEREEVVKRDMFSNTLS